MKKQPLSPKSETLSSDEKAALLLGLKSEESEKDVSLVESLEFIQKTDRGSL